MHLPFIFPAELWRWTPQTLEELSVDLDYFKTWVRPGSHRCDALASPAFHRNGTKAQSEEGWPGRAFPLTESPASAFLLAFITGLLWKALRLLSDPKYWEGMILLFIISFCCTLMYNFSVFFSTSRWIQKPWLSSWLQQHTPATAPVTAFVTEGQLQGREEH